MKQLIPLLFAATPALADVPFIENASATAEGDSWRFDVTLSHPDTGWGHYADGWEVLDVNFNRLGFRELVHPHVNEQPFTRSLSGVVLPEGTEAAIIRARCNLDGWNDDVVNLIITRD